ncbi:MAG: substrate-binding domain-containing protein [Marinospirillum sp.]|uniref:substrate-binding domain-containing protein n=1 Tax=Marinospirillum sp. TaxID=2183934 RepID=UPI001A108BE8|nr:substrate-binding domain-containing protein [Marinospirillum sp.]MBE0505480.1 substrate-binding domain-containing protein [Marinospirillum sp.]
MSVLRLALVMLMLVVAGISSAEPRFVVGFAQDTLANDWRKVQVQEVQAVLAQHPNIQFIVTDAQGKTALQAKHIEDLAAKGVDLLITSPRDQQALTPVIRQVYESGIPVILLSRGVSDESYTSYVYHDNRAIGQQAAEYLVKALQGQGRILMLEGVAGASTTLDRGQGFEAVIKKHPDITLIKRTANFLRADAILAVDALLASGESFDAVYAQSDSMAAGARMAMQLHGMDLQQVPLVGIDYIREAREALLLGQQALSFTFPTGGREGAELAIRILNGESVPRQVEIACQPVTPATAVSLEPIF